MKKVDFENFSGGAPGADMAWDTIGRKYDFNNHLHYRPTDYLSAPYYIQETINDAIEVAAIKLQRPQNFGGINLVRRNWFQQNNAEAIFAVSRIINPGELDKGIYRNKTPYQIVSGGTGWTVCMAQENNKPIYVFDLLTKQWYGWSYGSSEYIKIPSPVLRIRYAGIGTTMLTHIGRAAIEEVYLNTIQKYNLY